MNLRTPSNSGRHVSLQDELHGLEPELKRALYGAFERVQATKAALYLAVTHHDGQTLRLATSYAYDAAGRELIDARDPVVARMLTAPKPVIANGLVGDTALAEVMFRQGNQRLLALPIIGRGRRVVGIVDLRDKAAKKPFDDADVALAQTVADDIEKILTAKQLYGLGPIPLVRMRESGRFRIRRDDIPAAPHAPREPSQEVRPGVSPRALSAIRAAHERMQRRGVATEARRRLAIAEDFDRFRILLPAALAYPGVVAAAVTSVLGAERQLFVSSGPLSTDAVSAINRQIGATIGRAETERFGDAPILWTVAPDAAPITAARVRVAASVPVATRVFEGLMFSAAFEQIPNDEVREQLRTFASAFGDAIAALAGKGEWIAQRVAIAERLVEPDFQRLPGLGDHCRMVSGIAGRLAAALKLPHETCENTRIAALVHDVGLRLIDYENLSAKPRLTQEQMEAVREHPLVGAAIVEPLLGAEVAEIILRHHEHPDGKGYPERISGTRIPIGSRIVALADAWAAMTSPWSYGSAVPEEEAIRRLRAGAGTQFDANLVDVFLGNLRDVI